MFAETNKEPPVCLLQDFLLLLPVSVQWTMRGVECAALLLFLIKASGLVNEDTMTHVKGRVICWHRTINFLESFDES